jgi:hypothetical protein
MKINKVVNIQRTQNSYTKNQNKFGISQAVIDHFGLNMETMVGYKGEKNFKPAPVTVGDKLADYLNKLLQVDWRTHVVKKAPKQ